MILRRARLVSIIVALFAVVAFNMHAHAMAGLSWGAYHSAPHEADHDLVSHHHYAPSEDGTSDPHKSLHCANGCTIVSGADCQFSLSSQPGLRLRPPLSLTREGQLPPRLLRPPKEEFSSNPTLS
jgi:hypothetical protein